MLLEYRYDELLVIVEDNGRGFRPETPVTVKEWTGLGLLGIRERVAAVDGKLKLESEPGSGTTLVIRIPAPVLIQEKVFSYERAAHLLSR